MPSVKNVRRLSAMIGDYVVVDTHGTICYIESMQTIDAFDQQFSTFDQQFSTDEVCKQFLTNLRWPDGIKCPRCEQSEKIYILKTRPFHWVCKNENCGGKNGYRFSVISHTIFQDTKIPLKLWFKVAYLMLVAKKGISALQVHRVIFGEESGSDYRTSWYMCHRWRAAMKEHGLDQLFGEVEVDETYVGGKNKNRHKSKRINGRGTAGKIPVLGAIQRGGDVVTKVVRYTGTETLSGFVTKVVSKQASLVATDEHSGYDPLKSHGYPHESVTHSKGEYVRGNVHTAHIDSFWSLFKRGIVGSFHHVSEDYLQLYLNEFAFRQNNRKNPNAFATLIETCSK